MKLDEGEGSLRVRIGVSIARFVARIGKVEQILGELEEVRGTVGRPRPMLCRLGIHRWTAWSFEPEDYRTVTSKCRRCGSRRLLVWRSRETDAATIAANLRRDLCQTSRPSGK